MLKLIFAALTIVVAFPAHATEAGWALLRNGGQTVLLNHANAPGAGDPANFDIESCRTQRNLSERGRHQARRIGALLAARSAPVEEVYAGRYCRTLDTANLVFGESAVELMEALDLVTGDEERDAEAFRAVLERVTDYSGSGNMFMVTHPENVSEWAGIRSREGEAIIVAPDGEGLRVMGRVVLN
ncbi:histidine phosphatase family protein [Chelativorans sp. ZYF759]|uniref:histidine phosphatase family protein n=1 Tax=Chelativorans sp. ZYF759 TaxID=2692213 RepID=UPI00145C772B|nr:histidine phosphatase family protein [Chelativorans sp. ZYF759]NMG38766.1 histidine phosphatase family protein [Chelativorans sp. ZYF759]